MKTKHTPGPWRVQSVIDESGALDTDHVQNMSGRLICDFERSGNTPRGNEANARLIASAPDMLEALRRASKMFSDSGQVQNLNPAQLADIFHLLHEAIKKATI